MATAPKVHQSPKTRRGVPSRRSILHAIAAAISTSAMPAEAWTLCKADLRIVTLDAALTQTAIMLGTAPLAVSNVGFYRSFVIEPALPSTVMEIGLRSEPNIELLATLKPDLIFYSPEYGPLSATLPRHLQTCPVPIYQEGTSAYHAATVLAVRTMAAALGCRGVGGEHLDRMNDLLLVSRERLGELGLRSVCVLTFLSDRYVRVYAQNSLFDGVLEALGIRNVAGPPGNQWGFSDIPVSTLASYDADLFVHIGEIPARAQSSPIWKVLPFVRTGRVTSVPTIWMFGGLPSAARFAHYIVSAAEAVYERR